jgi:cephalosporin hydroxylase
VEKVFLFWKIYSIDIYDKSPQEEKRIKIFQGSQIDHNFLDKVMDNIDTPLDIIIDDGSHINEHVINTFEYLFPKLKLGGIYIIEDTQTSYRDEYLGDSNNLNNPNTIMNFFKRIPDCLNHSDFNIKDYTPNYLDKYISSIHFYHNLIFIYKGFNND